MSKTVSNRSWGEAIIAGLCSLGADRFFLSPGARSAPLVAALGMRDVTTHYDERGMAFAALGWSMATGRPAVCVTTSGSAVANLLPACVEAFHSNVPLIFLTADRPPELRGTGANQSIQQPGIFGSFVLHSVDLPCAADAGAMNLLTRELSKAVGLAKGRQPGPVHLNVPIREPLLENGAAEISAPVDSNTASEIDDLQWPTGFDFNNFASAQGVVVIGRLPRTEQGHVGLIANLAARLGWPLLADAASGARLLPGVIQHADWILQRHDVPPPQRVLHFGGALVSKRVGKWLGSCHGNNCLQVRMFPSRLDPWAQNPVFIRSRIQKFCRSLDGVALPAAPAPWLQSWCRANAAIAEVLDRILVEDRILTEPSILRAAAAAAVGGGIPVFLGNSMPIRDFDSCVHAVSSREVNVFANRGASGIDGNIATIAGLAMGSGSPVLAVIGDLAALHDLNSLPLLRGLPVTLVVINNGGGGIFKFLPITLEERLLETPHVWNFQAAAAQFGIPYHTAILIPELQNLLEINSAGPRIVECRTDREENHTLHLKITESSRVIPLSWSI